MKYLHTLIAIVSCFVFASCGGNPEKELVSHYAKIESIMEKHMDDPVVGAEKLIEYLQKHGAALRAAEVGVMMSIASIEKDGDRSAEIERLNKSTETARKNFEGVAEKFSTAVRNDSKARARMEDFGKRMRSANEIEDFNGMYLFF